MQQVWFPATQINWNRRGLALYQIRSLSPSFPKGKKGPEAIFKTCFSRKHSPCVTGWKFRVPLGKQMEAAGISVGLRGKLKRESCCGGLLCHLSFHLSSLSVLCSLSEFPVLAMLLDSIGIYDLWIEPHPPAKYQKAYQGVWPCARLHLERCSQKSRNWEISSVWCIMI